MQVKTSLVLHAKHVIKKPCQKWHWIVLPPWIKDQLRLRYVCFALEDGLTSQKSWMQGDLKSRVEFDELCPKKFLGVD